MKFANPFALIGLATLLSCPFALSAPRAVESSSQIDSDYTQKQALLRDLNAKIAKHERMSLSELQADLIAQARKNAAHLTRVAKGGEARLSSDMIHKNLMHSLDVVSRAQSTQELIAKEKETRDLLESSINVMFFFTKINESSNVTGEHDGAGRVWAALYLTMDFVTLPVTALVSAATGF